ncbi:MAG: GAF domain-containing protein [Pseudomonadota bacterium]
MDFSRDISVISGSPMVQDVLRELCDLTEMGFAAVARVTEHRWIACQVLDRVGFGLEPGSELKIKTTICDEIRDSGTAVFIDSVAEAPAWRAHPTPVLYGFQSYVSLPLYRADGSFFGTLCAIDPDPHVVDTPELRAAIQGLADKVVVFLDTEAV